MAAATSAGGSVAGCGSPDAIGRRFSFLQCHALAVAFLGHKPDVRDRLAAAHGKMMPQFVPPTKRFGSLQPTRVNLATNKRSLK